MSGRELDMKLHDIVSKPLTEFKIKFSSSKTGKKIG